MNEAKYILIDNMNCEIAQHDAVIIGTVKIVCECKDDNRYVIVELENGETGCARKCDLSKIAA